MLLRELVHVHRRYDHAVFIEVALCVKIGQEVKARSCEARYDELLFVLELFLAEYYCNPYAVPRRVLESLREGLRELQERRDKCELLSCPCNHVLNLESSAVRREELGHASKVGPVTSAGEPIVWAHLMP